MKLRPKEEQNRILTYLFRENMGTSAPLLRRARFMGENSAAFFLISIE
jgi:hypothetical protein